MSDKHPVSATVDSPQALADYLDSLIELGIEPVIFADARGDVGLLYPTGEYEVTWYAVDSNPYNIDNGVDGVALLYEGDPAPDEPELDHQYVRIDLDKLQTEGPGHVVYPLTLTHGSAS